MDISLHLDDNRHEPLYIQLYQYFREEITTLRIAPATRLPSIRQLSEFLQVSKTTIQMAYDQLLAEGYVESRERSGYYAVKLEDEAFGSIRPNHQKNLAAIDRSMKSHPIDIDFYMSSVDVHHFPFDTWRKYTNMATTFEQKELLAYGDRQGEFELRNSISHYLRQSRGVNCTPDQIVLGSGTQTVLQILCQLIGLDGRRVAIEEPGYRGARQVFQLFGYKLVPISLEEDGISVHELSRSDAKLVYITPSHQYPIGMVMPVQKRLKLLRWAEENQGIIIEDDYDGEFRYRGKPIPSLQGLDTHGLVVYVGTFSKSLMPAIRISYMVLPTHLLTIYQQRFNSFDHTVSRLHQRTLQLFMDNGEWDRHIRRMRTLYHKKHAFLLHTIKTVMGEHVNIMGQDAGLHIVIDVKSTIPADELVEIAARAGVQVYSTSHTWHQLPPKEQILILLGFGGLSMEQIEQGIKQLDEVWRVFYL
ncbi:PLP-dependent aminotransferase family protein [Paenibacillus albiflavus]|uniref:PLP-dependent aminotransferase family protein n=1 Tax=Paenibacillus albiflavus TaxID=2545760 RepID=A0A4R4EIW3_9BACL|nr:PLP-dependent aminotransferase family protein [Paenibacillus albiflavus]TCZ80114.1 PLP-dependent aminotransferase family protein [Paenibacillus albiflavus]